MKQNDRATIPDTGGGGSRRAYFSSQVSSHNMKSFITVYARPKTRAFDPFPTLCNFIPTRIPSSFPPPKDGGAVSEEKYYKLQSALRWATSTYATGCRGIIAPTAILLELSPHRRRSSVPDPQKLTCDERKTARKSR